MSGEDKTGQRLLPRDIVVEDGMPYLAELHLERARQPYPVNRYADGL